MLAPSVCSDETVRVPKSQADVVIFPPTSQSVNTSHLVTAQ